MTKKLPLPSGTIKPTNISKALKLKTGPATEAFDIKSAMTPVTGEGKKVDLSTFDEVKSKDGHSFYVFGTAGNEIRISLRLWKEASDKGTTTLGFRIRFGDRVVDGQPMPVNDAEFDELSGGNNIWTSAPSKGSPHRSVMGLINVPEAAWDPAKVIEFCAAGDYANLVYASLAGALYLPMELIDPDEFQKLWDSLIHVTLADMFKPADPTAKSALSWGSSNAPLLKVVNGTVMPKLGGASKAVKEPKIYPSGGEVLAQPVAHPKAFAAPHPKDAAKAFKTAAHAPDAV